MKGGWTLGLLWMGCVRCAPEWLGSGYGVCVWSALAAFPFAGLPSPWDLCKGGLWPLRAYLCWVEAFAEEGRCLALYS